MPSPKAPASSGGRGGAEPGDRTAISKKLRFKVLRRCGFRCRYCGCPSTEVQLTVDHIVAVSRDGTNDESNLVAACFDCNIGKGTGAAGIPPGVSFLFWLLAQAERDDWVGDLARDEVKRPALREPDGFRDLAAQVRAVEGGWRAVPATWHAWREYRYRGGRPTLLMRRMQAASAPIEVEQIASDVGVRALLVADVQLRQWAAAGTPSVWESLYAWLVSLGSPEKDSETGTIRSLHRRTYCGDALMDRLRDAETSRLRGKKVPGRWLADGTKAPSRTLCGRRLERAVFRSDLGSGPVGVWCSRTLVGDALFVLDDSKKELAWGAATQSTPINPKEIPDQC